MNLEPSDPRYARVHRIITSQAVTGEHVGIEHYAAMIGLTDDPAERLALVDDAWSERRHVAVMADAAERLGLALAVARDDPYWSRVRAAFRERVDARDLLGCRVIQDVVLESYAVALYEQLVPVVEPWLSERLARIAADERAHLATGVEALRAEAPERVDAAVELANERVARVLAEWVRPTDCAPVCAVCGEVGGGCAKDDLKAAGMDVAGLDAAFVEVYGRALRDAGLPPERVARWLARLLP
ncbi:MAG: long-chain fatty aldehyde decarbonylase [Myxococcota bacterium]